MVQKPGNKIAMEINLNTKLQFLAFFNASLDVKTLEERMFLETYVLMFPTHHRFYDSFNRKFRKMLEAGLFDFYVRELHEFLKRKVQQKPEQPFKVLTLEELEAGFVVSLFPLLLAVVVFCLEWLVLLKNLFLVSCVFSAYYHLKLSNMKRVMMAENFVEKVKKSIVLD